MALKLLVLLMISVLFTLHSTEANPHTMNKLIRINVIGNEIGGNNEMMINEGSSGNVGQSEIEIFQNVSQILGNNIINVNGIESDPTFQITATPSEDNTFQVTATPSEDTTLQITATPSKDTTIQVNATPSEDTTLQIAATPSKDTTIQVNATPSEDTTLQITATPSKDTTFQVTATPSEGLLEKVNIANSGGIAYASSSSHYGGGLEPIIAFGDSGFWHNGAPYTVPQTLWVEFDNPLRIVRYSFTSRTDIYTTTDGPSKYIFWASNHGDCTNESQWAILHADNSGTPFTSSNAPKEVTIDNRDSFRCYGFKVNDVPGRDDGRKPVTMANVKLYSYKVV